MPKAQRILAIGSCVGHLAIGLAILYQFGPTGNSAAWGVLDDFWPGICTPLAFIAIGVLAGVGLRDSRYLRLSLYGGSVLMGLWSAALAGAWLYGRGPQPSFIWIAWIGLLMWICATYWVSYDRQTAAVDRLSHDVARTIHQSERRRGE